MAINKIHQHSLVGLSTYIDIYIRRMEGSERNPPPPNSSITLVEFYGDEALSIYHTFYWNQILLRLFALYTEATRLGEREELLWAPTWIYKYYWYGQFEEHPLPPWGGLFNILWCKTCFKLQTYNSVVL